MVRSLVSGEVAGAPTENGVSDPLRAYGSRRDIPAWHDSADARRGYGGIAANPAAVRDLRGRRLGRCSCDPRIEVPAGNAHDLQATGSAIPAGTSGVLKVQTRGGRPWAGQRSDPGDGVAEPVRIV